MARSHDLQRCTAACGGTPPKIGSRPRDWLIISWCREVPFRRMVLDRTPSRCRRYGWMLGCKVVPSLDRCRQIFEANIETGKLSDIGLVLFENSAMDVTRPADHLARSENDELFFCRLMSGTLAGTGRTPGDPGSGRFGASGSSPAILRQCLSRLKIARFENTAKSGGGADGPHAADGGNRRFAV